MSLKNIIITIICLVFSIVMGLITEDILLGGTILFTGLLCAYFASVGKRANYVFGFINYLLMSYIAFKNNLYGIFFFYLLVFTPLQAKGYFTWNKNLDKENNVKARGFTLKNSLIIITSCLVGSFVLGFLLSLIPNQRLALMDATSNIINLCGVILMILRFREAWWLWLVNNAIDLTIWFLTFLNNGENSSMMLLTSIGYFVINIYGIIKWYYIDKKS